MSGTEGGTAATGATPPVPATGTAQPPSPPEPPEPATGSPAPAPGTTPEPPLGDLGIAALEAERTARREAEKEAKRLAAKLKEREDADKTETQRQADRLAELEAERAQWTKERRDVYVMAAVQGLQPKFGLIDVEAVARLMDASTITYDEHDRPQNVELAVQSLLQSKPYLGGGGRPQPPVRTNGNEGTSSAEPPRLTQAELEAAAETGMTAERYAALKGVKSLDEWQATRRPAAGTGTPTT